MGNMRSKTSLLSVLDRWDKSDPNNLEYKTYKDKVNDVVIHRVESDYYVECSSSTIGPMTREQLIAISLKDANIQLKNSKPEKVNSEGDTSNGSISQKVPLTSSVPQNLNRSPFSEANNLFKGSHLSDEGISKKNSLTNDFKAQPLKYTQTSSFKLSSKYTKKRIPEELSPGFFIKEYIRKLSSLENADKKGDARRAPENNNQTKEVKPIIVLVNPQNRIKEFNLSFSKKKNVKTDEEILDFNNINQSVEEGKGLSDAEGFSTTIDDCSLVLSRKESLGFTEPIANERFRYTAYAKTDMLNWSKQTSLIRRMSSGFDQRFGCNVQLGSEPIKYRGNTFYTVNIEGKDKISVLKCRNCLPMQLRSILIQSADTGEESATLAHEKWRLYTPYNPSLVKNVGSKSMKLSY